MSNSFLGGIWKRGTEARRRQAPSTEVVGEDWGWVGEHVELFLRGAPSCARLFRWDSLVLMLRGHARPRDYTGPLDLERVAEEVRCQYLEDGTLAVDDLDGSFTLALIDGQTERVLLYRNFVGTGFTYYHACGDGLLFGGNLVELVDASGRRPAANRDVLPRFFVYRAVPGRDTLFRDFYRLLPGEQVCWDRRGLTRVQRHTFADLRQDGGPATFDEAIPQLEATLSAVLADGASLRPGAVNLLSGGVDSSYIQAVWNGVVGGVGGVGGTPESVSISVDHPQTWADTDYAITASQALGTRHWLVPADDPYPGYMVDTLATTGEPLSHVQTAYFGHLARAMKARGIAAGVCGEGADSLFGLDLANKLQNAGVVRRLLPSRALQRLAGAVLGKVRCPLLAATCRLAAILDDMTATEHPVNTTAMFTDTEALRACFGPGALAQAMGERRGLLERMAVPSVPMERAHAAGYLGEAMDSASQWANLFQKAGIDLLCPFLDSRLIRFALRLPGHLRFPFRRPKEMVKRALERHVPGGLARRGKLGFGQPIFEWLGPGGALRPWVDRLGGLDFLDPPTLERLRRRPTWFLYSLVVYDQWQRLFIDRSTARPVRVPPVVAESLAS